MFSIVGITFHTYGLIVGIAIVVGLQLVEYCYKHLEEPLLTEKQLWRSILMMTVSGVIGARLWHVATDWYLYQQNIGGVVAIWNGGMSILGAVLGGIIGAIIFVKGSHFTKPKKVLLLLFDISIFGMPIAQAIGRFGNYVNQELYGFPTNAPWAITIDAAHRLEGFEQFSTYHPLFAYEAILTAVFGSILWFLWRIKRSWLQMGEGYIALSYVAYYSLVRFFLEFLRIDKTLFAATSLGLNQVILLMIGGVVTLLLVRVWLQKYGIKTNHQQSS